MVQQHPALLHGFRSAKRGLKPKLHRGGPDRFRGKPSAPHGQLLLKLGSRTIVFRIFFFLILIKKSAGFYQMSLLFGLYRVGKGKEQKFKTCFSMGGAVLELKSVVLYR